jgi:hypothetical protein
VSHEGTGDLFPTAKHGKFALFLSTSMADYKNPAGASAQNCGRPLRRLNRCLREPASHPEKRAYLDAINSDFPVFPPIKQNIGVRNNRKTVLCNLLVLLKLASEKIF